MNNEMKKVITILEFLYFELENGNLNSDEFAFVEDKIDVYEKILNEMIGND